MESFFEKVLFEYNDYTLTAGMLVVTSLLIVLGWLLQLLFFRISKSFIPELGASTPENKRVRQIFTFFSISTILLIIVWGLKLNPFIVQTKDFELKVSTLLIGLIIILFAWLIDVLVYGIFIPKYQMKENEQYINDNRSPTPQRRVSTYARYLIYLVATIVLLKFFNIDYSLFQIKQDNSLINFRISKILFSALILLLAPIIAWMVSTFLINVYYNRIEVDQGFKYSVNQLIKYILYVFALFIAVENLGVKMTVIWGGAAALLVGVGLGLQQTFNDFFSGIILLFERSVQVGDVLELDGMVGTVKRIGIRTSLLETRDSVSVIVPNSRMVTNNVVNWSYYDQKARFYIAVGVAYGSDTQKVKDILIETAKKHEAVLAYPMPMVRFVDFADSSLNFQLHFWTTRFIPVEDIKSDLRFEIDLAFRKEGVHIPFPQRDVWFRQ